MAWSLRRPDASEAEALAAIDPELKKQYDAIPAAGEAS